MNTIFAETQAQLNDCLYVRTEVFVKEQEVPMDLEVDEFDVFPLNCNHVLIKDGEQPIGAARLRGYEGGAAKYQRIAVLKEYRGKGIGNLLLESMEQRAQQEGYRSAVLDAQVQAIPFYEKAGFHVVSEETFLDAGIPHVRMKKIFI
ncbi:hypothetical protein SY83_15290 [Paenibacillus swuensis]|uniref:N-acetyltransferase domain-containing protein n=1 Tax=Paenibacillus swuensis TaxID=1178515 RepID=A0A172TK36_9BACL|nr:GNAT family N-acetyltransferase [Paenibacillus swuensis]ANE47411.1 hypothetical protein SY83_15290 [Paenibacillus swuensis]